MSLLSKFCIQRIGGTLYAEKIWYVIRFLKVHECSINFLPFKYHFLHYYHEWIDLISPTCLTRCLRLAAWRALPHCISKKLLSSQCGSSQQSEIRWVSSRTTPKRTGNLKMFAHRWVTSYPVRNILLFCDTTHQWTYFDVTFAWERDYTIHWQFLYI